MFIKQKWNNSIVDNPRGTIGHKGIESLPLADICVHENSGFQIRERVKIGIYRYPAMVAPANPDWRISERANRWRIKIAKRKI